MKKRNKIILSTMSGLMATTSVVIPLSSCAKQQENNIYEVIDKEYGVTEATYEKLKGSFSNEIDAYIAKEGMTPDQEAAFREEYNETINRFDELSTTNKYGWTSLTSAMVDYARNTYQFKLARESSVKWSELASIYNGMAKSMKTYMESSKLAPTLINKILTEARARFDTIEKSLKEKYGNDALGGMIEAKNQIITCFEDTNDEIALVSATQRLADFADEYQFEYDENSTENRLNDLRDAGKLKEGEPIDDDTMNKLFKITKKSSPDIEDFTFDSSKMIPMFTVTPTLKEIRDDEATNNHSVLIDFSLIKSYYITKYTPEKQEAVTAHLRKANLVQIGSQIKNNTKTLNQIIQDLPVQTLEFPVEVTADQEKKNIEKVYFNPESEAGMISFKWAEPENQAYEAFFDGTKRDEDDSNHWTGDISLQALANAGLQISFNGKDYAPCSSYVKNSAETNEALNLAEQFVSNCTIHSNIDITDEGDGQNFVTNNFHISFQNSRYNSAAAEYTYKAPDCTNYLISEKYFELTNQKFGEVYGFVSTYINRDFKVCEKNANGGIIAQTCALFGSLAAVGFECYNVIKTWKKHTPKANLINVIIIILSLVVFSVQCIEFNLYRKQYYNKIKDYNKNVNDFMDEFLNNPDEKLKPIKDMLDQIEKDKNDLFVIPSEDGHFDEDEYARKAEQFRAMGVEAMEINRHYSTIMDSDEMTQFIQLQKEKQADKDHMNKELGEWITGGKYWIISFLLTIVISLLSVGTMYLKTRLIKQEKEEKGGLISQDEEIAKEIGEESGETIYESQQVNYQSLETAQNYMNKTRPWILQQMRTQVGMSDVVWNKFKSKMFILDQLKEKYVNEEYSMLIEMSQNDDRRPLLEENRDKELQAIEEKFEGIYYGYCKWYRGEGVKPIVPDI